MSSKNIFFTISSLIFIILINSYFNVIINYIVDINLVKIYIENSNFTFFTSCLLPIIFYILSYYFISNFNYYFFKEAFILLIHFSLLLNFEYLNKILEEQSFQINMDLCILIFLLLGIITLIKYKVYIINNEKSEINTFIIDPDKALNSIDENYRDDFIGIRNLMYDIVTNHFSDKCLSIAISGDWGSGKSSLLNLVKIKINSNNKLKVLNFNPRRCEEKASLLNSFFSLLSSSLKSITLTDKVNKYLSIIGANNNFLYNAMNIIYNESEENIYKIISQEINKIDLKIVIFIDDLDRLEEIEILEIFKIIQICESFKNIIFICAMDEDYIKSTINKKDNYINKFFQYKRYIPPINSEQQKNIITKLFNDRFTNIIPEKEIRNEYLSLLINPLSLKDLSINRQHDSTLSYYLTNIRDIKNFLSSLYCTIKLQKEINNIIEKYKNDNDIKYNFRNIYINLFDKLQVIKIVLIYQKYSKYIKFEKSYILHLISFLNDHESKVNPKIKNISEDNDKNSDIFNGMEYKYSSIKGFKELLFDGDALSLLKSLFIQGTNDKNGQLNIHSNLRRNIFLFFENYDTQSVNISDICSLEFSIILDNINDTEGIYNFEINTLYNTVFNLLETPNKIEIIKEKIRKVKMRIGFSFLKTLINLVKHDIETLNNNIGKNSFTNILDDLFSKKDNSIFNKEIYTLISTEKNDIILLNLIYQLCNIEMYEKDNLLFYRPEYIEIYNKINKDNTTLKKFYQKEIRYIDNEIKIYRTNK